MNTQYTYAINYFHIYSTQDTVEIRFSIDWQHQLSHAAHWDSLCCLLSVVLSNKRAQPHLIVIRRTHDFRKQKNRRREKTFGLLDLFAMGAISVHQGVESGDREPIKVGHSVVYEVFFGELENAENIKVVGGEKIVRTVQSSDSTWGGKAGPGLLRGREKSKAWNCCCFTFLHFMARDDRCTSPAPIRIEWRNPFLKCYEELFITLKWSAKVSRTLDVMASSNVTCSINDWSTATEGFKYSTWGASFFSRVPKMVSCKIAIVSCTCLRIQGLQQRQNYITHSVASAVGREMAQRQIAGKERIAILHAPG